MSSKKLLSRQERRAIVDSWRESGLTIRQFCQRENIREARFYDWRKKLCSSKSQDKQSSIKFLPVQVSEVVNADISRQKETPQRIEILLGNGAIIRISGELSNDNLSRLMKLAAGAPC